MIPRFKPLPLPRKLTSLRRGFAQTLPQFRLEMKKILGSGRKYQWTILKVEDKTFQVKRLQATVLIPEGLTRKEIEPMLIEAVRHVREKQYRTPEVKGYKRRYRKYMAKRKPAYVWLFVYTREKRPTDMWADPESDFFVCRAEWFDETIRETGLKPVMNLPDKVTDSDITVDWSPKIQ